MMAPALSTPKFTLKSAFDPVVKWCAAESFSFTEETALRECIWDLGEEGYLREDVRFRQTPWGRWLLSDRFLANEAVYRSFHRDCRSERAIPETLKEVAEEMGRACVFCVADPRFVVKDGMIRLAAAELSDQPRLEETTELERYKTHLPLHTLMAVAASEPAGEWGSRAQEEMIETLGWVKVEVPGHGMNDRMFVARIKGHSMDTGRNGLKDGTLAVFELWPAGTRTGRDVLVRGSFADPEFSNYALKRYEGAERDENLERKTIRLISLNPDKDRYPDIALTAEEAPDLEVVAELISPLAPDRYGRLPKPPRSKGRRDLTSADGQQRMQKTLDEAVQKFFEAKARPSGVAETEDRSGWAACLVCLDAEAGALHVETGGLAGFPSFVKTLRLIAGSSDQPVIASNLTSRTWRTPVPPSQEGYRWVAPGFEGMLDEDFARISVPGLPADRVTVFRVEASGIGRLLTGSTLSLGQHYRVVLPSGMAAGAAAGEVAPLGKGWSLWELIVPGQVPEELASALKVLGLDISKAVPSMEWIGTPASRYDANAAGESYPVFGTELAPVLRISGIKTRAEGDLVLFVAGGGHFESFALPTGESWWISLVGLPPGAYVAEAAHKRTSVGRARLPFRVAENPTVWPKWDVALSLGEERYLPDADGMIALECDLTPACDAASDTRLLLQAHAFRRVAAFWSDGRRRRIADLYVDEAGKLDVAAECGLLSDLVNRSPLGNLDLDLGELGSMRLLHRRDVAVRDILARLRDLMSRKGASAEALRGQYPLLRALWLDPLLALLYHGVSELDESYREDLPEDSGATVLVVEEISREGGRIVRSPRRVVVLAPDENAVLNAKAAGLCALADQVCNKLGLTEAVLTDGFLWGLHAAGRKVQPVGVNLRAVLQEGREDLFESFLFSHAVTV